MTEQTHHPTLKELESFIDGAVPPFEAERLAEHLTSCGDCRHRLAMLRLEGDALRDALRASRRVNRGRRVRRWAVAATVLCGLVLLSLLVYIATRPEGAGRLLSADGPVRLQVGPSAAEQLDAGRMIPSGGIVETSYAQMASIGLPQGWLELNELTRVRLDNFHRDAAPVCQVEILRGELYLGLENGSSQVELAGPNMTVRGDRLRGDSAELNVRLLGGGHLPRKPVNDEPTASESMSLELTVVKGRVLVAQNGETTVLDAPVRALFNGKGADAHLHQVPLENVPSLAWRQMDVRTRARRQDEREEIERAARSVVVTGVSDPQDIDGAVALEMAALHRRLAREEPMDEQALRHLDAALAEYDRVLAGSSGRAAMEIVVARAATEVTRAERLWELARLQTDELFGDYGRRGLEAEWALDQADRLLDLIPADVDQRTTDLRAAVEQARTDLLRAVIESEKAGRDPGRSDRLAAVVEQLDALLEDEPPAHLRAKALTLRAQAWGLRDDLELARADYQQVLDMSLFALPSGLRREMVESRAEALLAFMRLLLKRNQPGEALDVAALHFSGPAETELRRAGALPAVLWEIRGVRIRARAAYARMMARREPREAEEALQRAFAETAALSEEGFHGALQLESLLDRLATVVGRPQRTSAGASQREQVLSRLLARTALGRLQEAQEVMENYLALGPTPREAGYAVQHLAVAYLMRSQGRDRRPGDERAAADYFRQMLRINPDVVDEVYEQVAAHLYRVQDYHEAARVVGLLLSRMAARGDPSDSARLRQRQLLQVQGHYLFRAGRYTECVRTLERVGRDLSRERREDLARAREQLDDFSGALEEWRLLSTGRPAEHTDSELWWRAQLNECRLLVQMDRFDEALREIRSLRQTTDLGGTVMAARFDELELQALTGD